MGLGLGLVVVLLFRGGGGEVRCGGLVGFLFFCFLAKVEGREEGMIDRWGMRYEVWRMKDGIWKTGSKRWKIGIRETERVRESRVVLSDENGTEIE